MKRRAQTVSLPIRNNNDMQVTQPTTPRENAARNENGLITSATSTNVNVRGPSAQHTLQNEVGDISRPPSSLSPQHNSTVAFGKEESLIVVRIVTSAVLLIVVLLYTLNQKKQLPRRFSRVVTKVLFWPTIPLTFLSRGRNWMTMIDDTVVMGAAPFGFAGIPTKLRHKEECTGVINMCEEYSGPTTQYLKLGMQELRLPTPDHFEPSFEDYKNAVSFIVAFEQAGQRVYIHCRSGHGRSAAVAFAWMIYKRPDVDPQTLNEDMVRKRDVRRTLWQQPNLRKFRSWVLDGGRVTPAQIDTVVAKKRAKRGGSIDTLGTSVVSTTASEAARASVRSSIEMTDMSYSARAN